VIGVGDWPEYLRIAITTRAGPSACTRQEVLRSAYAIDDADTAAVLVAQLGVDLPAIRNLVKRVKRVAFGMTDWINYRTGALLYAGRPDCTLRIRSAR
jgi:hypothetical protein